MTEELSSAIREGVRTAVIAVIGLLIPQIQQGMVIPEALIAAFIIGILRAIERYLHAIGKQTGLEFEIIR